MKSRIRLIAIIASSVVLLAVLVLVLVNVFSCNSTVTLSAEKAWEYYDRALENALTTEDFTLDITTAKNTTVDKNQYSFSTHQIVTYDGFGTDSMIAQSQETMTIGETETAITESFVSGTAYFTVDGATFTGSMTADAFVDRFVPVAMFDQALYTVVTGTKSEEGISIQFAEPAQCEAWCAPYGAELVAADGAVQLSPDGRLQTTVYHITYSTDTESVDVTVTVSFLSAAEGTISIPTGKNATAAQYLDAARDLEIMYGYLLQSDKIYAEITESINCQAGGIQRTQATVLDVENINSQLKASIETTVGIVDYNDGGDTATSTQKETFENDVYSISVNDGEAEIQPNVTAQQTLAYCQDLLVKNVILPENIASVSTATEGDIITLQIVGTEELAQLICKNVCKTLYDNPDLLNDLASSYKTNQINCYYRLNAETGLPISAGLEYGGEHIIEGFAYALTYNAEIVYGKPVVYPNAQPEETIPTEETTAPQT